LVIATATTAANPPAVELGKATGAGAAVRADEATARGTWIVVVDALAWVEKEMLARRALSRDAIRQRSRAKDIVNHDVKSPRAGCNMVMVEIVEGTHGEQTGRRVFGTWVSR
jgi:hypothetical protein